MMINTSFIVTILACLAYVDSTGMLVDPPPRPITDDFRNKLPPTIRGLPERDLQKLPNDYVTKKYGKDTAQKFKDFTGPCGGIPSQPGRSTRVQPGRPAKFSFDVDNGSSDARCKLTLSCPNKSLERILWSGDCRDAKTYSQDVMIPRDVGPCNEGECYVQWSMETKSDKFCNCADVVVETPPSSTSSAQPSSSSITSSLSSTAQSSSSTKQQSSSSASTILTSSAIPTLTSKILIPSSTVPISSSSSFVPTSTSSSSIITTSSKIPKSSKIIQSSSTFIDTTAISSSSSISSTLTEKINPVTSTIMTSSTDSTTTCSSSMISSYSCATCSTNTPTSTCSTCTAIQSTSTCSTCTGTVTKNIPPSSTTTESSSTICSSCTSNSQQITSAPQFTTITSSKIISSESVVVPVIPVTVTEKRIPITKTETITMVFFTIYFLFNLLICF